MVSRFLHLQHYGMACVGMQHLIMSSASVLIKPEGRDIASIYGDYLSESQLRKVAVGDHLEVLCSDGLNYFVTVKSFSPDTGLCLLHFNHWPTRFDFKGCIYDLYLAPAGRYSEGILRNNTYRQDFLKQNAENRLDRKSGKKPGSVGNSPTSSESRQMADKIHASSLEFGRGQKRVLYSEAFSKEKVISTKKKITEDAYSTDEEGIIEANESASASIMSESEVNAWNAVHCDNHRWIVFRPFGDHFASGLNNYYSLRDIVNLRVGDELAVLCVDRCLHTIEIVNFIQNKVNVDCAACQDKQTKQASYCCSSSSSVFANDALKCNSCSLSKFAHIRFVGWTSSFDCICSLKAMYISPVIHNQQFDCRNNSLELCAENSHSCSCDSSNTAGHIDLKYNKVSTGVPIEAKLASTRYPDDYFSVPRLNYRRISKDSISERNALSSENAQTSSSKSNFALVNSEYLESTKSSILSPEFIKGFADYTGQKFPPDQLIMAYIAYRRFRELLVHCESMSSLNIDKAVKLMEENILIADILLYESGTRNSCGCNMDSKWWIRLLSAKMRIDRAIKEGLGV